MRSNTPQSEAAENLKVENEALYPCISAMFQHEKTMKLEASQAPPLPPLRRNRSRQIARIRGAWLGHQLQATPLIQVPTVARSLTTMKATPRKTTLATHTEGDVDIRATMKEGTRGVARP